MEPGLGIRNFCFRVNILTFKIQCCKIGQYEREAQTGQKTSEVSVQSRGHWTKQERLAGGGIKPELLLSETLKPLLSLHCSESFWKQDQTSFIWSAKHKSLLEKANKTFPKWSLLFFPCKALPWLSFFLRTPPWFTFKTRPGWPCFFCYGSFSSTSLHSNK